MNEYTHLDPTTGQPISQAPIAPPPNWGYPPYPYTNPLPQTAAKPKKVPKPKRYFSTKEKLFAYLFFLLGYLFCRTFWVWEKPLVGLLFTICLFGFSLVFHHNNKKLRSWFYPISALVLSCSFFFSSSPALLLLVFIYIFISFFLFCQTGSSTALENHAGQLYVFETIKAVFISPFKNLGSAIEAIFSNKDSKKISKTLLIILLAILLSVIPTSLVLRLLSFDSSFTAILDSIRTVVFDKFFTQLLSILMGIPIGMYLYSSVYTFLHTTPDSLTAEKCIKAENDMKFTPTLFGAVAILPLLFLYSIFIIAQFDYYEAIFTSTLPSAFTFSQFARDGFFRLCNVAVINAVTLVALRIFSKKSSHNTISPVVKVYTILLSLFTIIISGTAISQMIMYVSAYGLTRLRLYTLWFMALLILLFFIAILKQCFEKMPFAATTLVTFVLCFSLLVLPDTDAIIAHHNYNCQLASTYELDVEYLGKLAPSSIPILCEVIENKDIKEEVRSKARNEVENYIAKNNPINNLPSFLADKAYSHLKN